jgi:hypothetical protein
MCAAAKMSATHTGAAEMRTAATAARRSVDGRSRMSATAATAASTSMTLGERGARHQRRAEQE